MEPLNRKTVVRKLLFFSRICQDRLRSYNEAMPLVKELEFDDLETSLNTKLRPVSVSIAVETGTRRILGFEVSQMPPKRKLSALSIKKFGVIKDERPLARASLFEKIKPFVFKDLVLKTDKNPGYPPSVRRFFPHALHIRVKGRKARQNGQGELKVGGWDPLFSLNHTCAMLRANVNRLIRKSWCTSKRIDRLFDHILIYVCYHNEFLILNKAK